MTPNLRTILGDRLQHFKTEVAEEVTQIFLERHPDWLARYGERARKFGIEDAQFHIDFLRGAVEAGSVQAFEDYCEWAAGLLRSRSIATDFLIENLSQIDTALRSRLSADEQAVVAPMVDAGCAACHRQRCRPPPPARPWHLPRQSFCNPS